ncbi:MAG: HAD family hydrolase [Burkholderiales bacterium]
MTRPTLIGLDADDTLWHNEPHFQATQTRLREMLAPYAPPERIDAQLLSVERRNLDVYGYGVKGFTLSMIETALTLSDATLPATSVAEILSWSREMMRHPVEPLPGVHEALAALAERAPLVLITKGDLFHQESKLAASGLGDFFAGIEIVSEKSADVYGRIFKRYGTGAEHALMAGNSVRSDVLPALEAGAHAAWIPYPLLWELEAAEAPATHPRFRQLAAIGELAAWIDALA